MKAKRDAEIREKNERRARERAEREEAEAARIEKERLDKVSPPPVDQLVPFRGSIQPVGAAACVQEKDTLGGALGASPVVSGVEVDHEVLPSMYYQYGRFGSVNRRGVSLIDVSIEMEHVQGISLPGFAISDFDTSRTPRLSRHAILCHQAKHGIALPATGDLGSPPSQQFDHWDVSSGLMHPARSWSA